MAYNWPVSSKAGTTTTGDADQRIDQARADINQNIQNVNAILDTFNLGTEPANNKILKYNTTTDKFELADESGGGGGFDGTSNLVVSNGVSLLTPDSTAGITFQTSGSTFGTGVDYIQVGNIEAAGEIRPAGSSGEIGTASARFNMFAGNINISGTQTGGNSTVGVHDIWVPAQAMYPTADGGPETHKTTEIQEGTPELRSLDYDASTSETAQFSIAMPKSWNEGTITFTAYWTAGSGSGNVRWGLQATAISNGTGINASFGTPQIVTDTYSGTANQLHITPTSSALTVHNTPSANDLCFFQIYRDADDSGDTLTVDAQLIGIKIHYTTEAETDA